MAEPIKVGVNLGMHPQDAIDAATAFRPLGPGQVVTSEGGSEAPALLAARQRLAAAQARREAAQAALEEARTSAEAQAADLERQALEAEQEAQRLEHERHGEAVYRAECARRGSDRVAIVRTKLGPVVMRPMTEVEDENLTQRQANLKSGVDVVKAGVDAMLETVLYPPPAIVRAWIGEYAGLGYTLLEVRRELLDARVAEARGKA